jgi:hypothetical protein
MTKKQQTMTGSQHTMTRKQQAMTGKQQTTPEIKIPIGILWVIVPRFV